jgi:hypothetical protein
MKHGATVLTTERKGESITRKGEIIMWIDADNIRFDDYHPDVFSEDELLNPEEQAEFERVSGRV